MSRFHELDDFLGYFAQVYEQNPSLEITEDTIYHAMMEYGISNEERNHPDIRNYFGSWIQKFEKTKNLVVYQDLRQKSFLQFHNQKDKKDYKYVKLYLNYSKTDIYDSVNRVFGFMAKKNILHYSKVADRVRSDDVVLRIGTTKDAENIISHINSDSKLASCARTTNPFVFRYGVVGIAYDDLLSYNSVVSSIVAKYLNNCRAKNILDEVSLDHFRNYASNLYNYNFRTTTGIQTFSKSSEFYQLANRRSNKEELLLNLEQIYKMLILSLDEKTKLKDVINHIDACQNKKNNMEMCAYYRGVLNNAPQRKSSEIAEVKRIIDEFILYIVNRQGFGVVKTIFEEYMQGNYNYITRTNNFRNLFIENVNPQDIYQVTGTNIDLYEKHIYESMTSQKETPVQMNKKDLLDQFIQHNLKNYGEQMTINQLNGYIEGNPNAITRDHNFRNLFMENITPADIIKITSNDIRCYVNMFVDPSTVNPIYDMAKSILDQYITYLLYMNVSTQQIESYLQFYCNGNVNAITEDRNFRQLFQSYIPPQVLQAFTSNNITGYIDYMRQAHFGVSEIDDKGKSGTA